MVTNGSTEKKEKSEIRLKKIFCIKYNKNVVENERRNNRLIFTVIFLCVHVHVFEPAFSYWLATTPNVTRSVLPS